jgi:hypothetical protein
MKRLIAFALLVCTSSCTLETVRGPLVITTKPLPDASKARSGTKVKGESCTRWVLIFIPVGFGSPNRAYNQALAEAPGSDTLLRYEARSSMFFSPLYSHWCDEIHGYAVSSKTLE